jgi:hypothetical protein
MSRKPPILRRLADLIRESTRHRTALEVARADVEEAAPKPWHAITFKSLARTHSLPTEILAFCVDCGFGCPVNYALGEHGEIVAIAYISQRSGFRHMRQDEAVA